MLYLTGERIIVSPQLNRVSLVIGKMDVHDELAAPVAKGYMFAVVHVTTTNHMQLPTPDSSIFSPP